MTLALPVLGGIGPASVAEPAPAGQEGPWWPVAVVTAAVLAVVVARWGMERLRVSRPRVWWPLFGAPVALWRLACTWRVLCEGCDLVLPARHATRYGLLTSGSRRHRGGGVIVRGAPVRVIVPRRVGLRLTSTGFMVTVRLFASQTPGAYAKAAEAMAHAWRKVKGCS